MAIVREYVREPEHHPHENENRSSNTNSLIWGVVLIVLLALLFTYGLPAIREMASNQGPQITVPERIDVNVNNPNAAPQPQGGEGAPTQ